MPALPGDFGGKPGCGRKAALAITLAVAAVLITREARK